MKKCTKNMNGEKSTKKGDKAAKVRATISISGDVDPANSEKVRTRMRERRAASFSNYIEILVAEDTGLKQPEALPA